MFRHLLRPWHLVYSRCDKGLVLDLQSPLCFTVQYHRCESCPIHRWITLQPISTVAELFLANGRYNPPSPLVDQSLHAVIEDIFRRCDLPEEKFHEEIVDELGFPLQSEELRGNEDEVDLASSSVHDLGRRPRCTHVALQAPDECPCRSNLQQAAQLQCLLRKMFTPFLERIA